MRLVAWFSLTKASLPPAYIVWLLSTSAAVAAACHILIPLARDSRPQGPEWWPTVMSECRWHWEQTWWSRAVSDVAEPWPVLVQPWLFTSAQTGLETAPYTNVQSVCPVVGMSISYYSCSRRRQSSPGAATWQTVRNTRRLWFWPSQALAISQPRPYNTGL